MCRAHVRQGELHVKQSKTGTSLVLPLMPETGAAIAAMPDSANPFDPYLMRDGCQFEPLEFTCWFIRAARKAGLGPGKTAHGLRKAACRRLAEAGCSANEIASVSGHRDWREIRRYTDAAGQRGMARTGMGRVAEAFSGPENTGETFFGNRGGNPLGKRS